jgi:hypothetical protein
MGLALPIASGGLHPPREQAGTNATTESAGMPLTSDGVLTLASLPGMVLPLVHTRGGKQGLG